MRLVLPAPFGPIRMLIGFSGNSSTRWMLLNPSTVIQSTTRAGVAPGRLMLERSRLSRWRAAARCRSYEEDLLYVVAEVVVDRKHRPSAPLFIRSCHLVRTLAGLRW